MADGTSTARSGGSARAWLVVVAVGVLVEVVVFGLALFPRLTDGQDLLDAAEPAFTDERVAGDRAGITMVSRIVDTADPLATPGGGAGAEVPKLIAFVTEGADLSRAEVAEALEKNFPHTNGLLGSVPLSEVTAELPKVQAAVPGLARAVPRIGQSATNLPDVTRGWNRVPGTAGFTRFDGSPVRTVPEVRDYFANDLVAAVERSRADFQDLTDKGGIGFIPFLLTMIGAVAILFGLTMWRLQASGALRPGLLVFGWSVVTLVGVLVLALVFGLSLFSRLSGGEKVLDNLRPAFTEERVEGARAGITIVSKIVDTADPLATPDGGAAAEVPKLVAAVARRNDISEAEATKLLAREFPRTLALLTAAPLSDVTAELPGLIAFLATSLKLNDAEVVAALEQNFPRLSQSIDNLPPVTRGWNDVPGTRGLTRFSGKPVKTVPDVRDYFAQDVIPVLEDNRDEFNSLDDRFPRVNVFAPLLTAVGAIVVLFGLLMLATVTRGPRGRGPRADQEASQAASSSSAVGTT